MSGLDRAGVRSLEIEHGLVSRFRSSHHCAATSFANFGIEGHWQLVDLVWLWFRSPHFGLAAKMMRTSEPPHSSLSGFPELLEHLSDLPKSVIAHRHASINPLLQNDLLDIVGREAALCERCAHVHATLFPPPHPHHGT